LINPELKAFAWRQGDLSYKLRNIQKKLKQEWVASKSISRKWYLECSRRLGKSTLMLTLLVEACLKKPGTRCLFVAPVEVGLEKYIAPVLAQVLQDCPQELSPKLDSSNVLTFKNGSVIHFTGSNNKSYNSKRGNSYDLAACDEGRDIDDLEALIESVILPALFTTNGYLLLASTPADTEDSPLHSYYEQAVAGKWYSHYTIHDAAKWDPASYPADRIAEWRKETREDHVWDREYLAKWSRNVNTVVVPEWDKKWIRQVAHDEYFPFFHKYVSMDFGVNDKTAVLFAYYNFNLGKLIVEEEFTLQGEEVRTDTIASMIKHQETVLSYQIFHDIKDIKYKAMEKQERVYRRIADNNNKQSIQDLNGIYDLNFVPTTKDELTAMINEVRIWVNSGRIWISPKCTELIGCLENAQWDRHHKELGRSKVFGHFDMLMALVYMIRNIDEVSNPVPALFAKSIYTHSIPYKDLTDAKDHSLGDMFRKANAPTKLPKEYGGGF